MSDKLTYEEKKELPDSVFGLPERREYPMPDAVHVRAAEAYFRYCPATPGSSNLWHTEQKRCGKTCLSHLFCQFLSDLNIRPTDGSRYHLMSV